uniref:uncharacterized protein LOC105352652 n=1 Tax=Fragaria vesca subsp. vesca TaxID=101020 RepID=UPI0005C9D300|nr:PREDICTED: uncharacterized protein LOC105352652 [Fragaria vesca subsp. vesca]
MARLSLSTKRKLVVTINALLGYLRILFAVCVADYKRREYLYTLVYWSDAICIDQLRMDRQSFHKLCQILISKGQLRSSRNVSVVEMVAMFLNILAHHKKNRSISLYFTRSGRTVSKYFHECLKAMIRCQKDFWKTLEPVPENSTDNRWKWFKNCLGALDGTHIRVKVPERDKPRYRTRKSEIATNVLGACSQDLRFIYVLPGWEGSAHDARVLKDALSRRNGLKVLKVVTI